MYIIFQKVIDIFKKYVGIDINPEIIATDEYNYRNKIVLHVVNGKLGYYEKNSNNIVEIDKCLIASNAINEVIAKIKDNLKISVDKRSFI